MSYRIVVGDALTELKKLPDESVHCCVSSPPYWGLRDYGVSGQLGLEPTPEEYVANLVAVFREVKRVLRSDGTCWVNAGDSFSSGMRTAYDDDRHKYRTARAHDKRPPTPNGLKPKDLCGIPWRLAFALQADGWWLRSDIVWSKANCLPESVADRPTRSHEYVFLLTKAERYCYDAEAIREPITTTRPAALNFRRENSPRGQVIVPSAHVGTHRADREDTVANPAGRNARSVWTIPTQPRPEAHFAAFPDELARRCILAGSPEKACPTCGAPWERAVERVRTKDGVPIGAEHRGWPLDSGRRLGPEGVGHWRFATETRQTGSRPTCSCPDNDGSGRATVLDPFLGRGTTLVVAARYGRDGIGIELNPEYAEMAQKNIEAEDKQGWLFSKAMS